MAARRSRRRRPSSRPSLTATNPTKPQRRARLYGSPARSTISAIASHQAPRGGVIVLQGRGERGVQVRMDQRAIVTRLACELAARANSLRACAGRENCNALPISQRRAAAAVAASPANASASCPCWYAASGSPAPTDRAAHGEQHPRAQLGLGVVARGQSSRLGEGCLGEPSARSPERIHRGAQPQRRRWVARHRVVDRGREVGRVGLQPAQPLRHAWRLELRRRLLGDSEEVSEVAVADRARRVSPGARARTRARSPAAGSASLGRAARRSPATGRPATRADRGCRRRPASAASSENDAGEHRDVAQQSLLVGSEQVVTPVDRGAQRLLARDRRPRSAGQQRQAIRQPLGELLDRQQPQPRRGQLDRKRQPVQVRADRRDRVRRL